MRFIPGPDLPTGGKIVGLDGIRDAYETGRGTFRMRATARIETVTPRRKGIVVTELPYGVGTEKVIERIKTLVQGKKLQGISDIKDLTDRDNGLRLVIEVKNGFHPEALLEQLYRQTPMEDSFGINNVALVDGQPRTLGLKEMLEVFLEHRFDVVRRRSAFRRAKAADRLHLVDGLLIAILDIDEVIQLIRSSDNAGEAKRAADARSSTSPRPRPTTSSTCRCAGSPSSPGSSSRRSRPSCEREIEELDAILADERAAPEGRLRRAGRGRQDLRHPAAHGAARVGRHRPSPPPPSPLEVADDPCFVFLSSTGLLARTATDEAPGTGGGRANHDVVVSAVRTTARGEVGVAHLARAGCVKLGVLDLPDAARLGQRPATCRAACRSASSSRSSPASGRWRLTSLPTDGPGLALGTRQGVVKRVNPEVLARDEWEVDRAQGRRRGRRRGRAGHRRRDALLHHLRRPAAALRRRRRPPAGPLGRRHRRHQARRRRARRLVRRPRPRRRRRGHRLRLVDRAARHRARRGEGDPVRGVPAPRAAPPAASAATASSRARTPWSSPGPAPAPPGPPPPAAPRSTCPSRRPARRLRRARAASRSPPSPARWRRRLARRPVWKADAHARPRAAAPAAAPGRRPCSSRRRAGAVLRAAATTRPPRSEQTPEEVLAQAEDRRSTRPAGVQLDARDRRPARRRHRASPGPTGVGTHAPAFEGTITVVLSGNDFEVPVVAVDDKVYAQLPLTPGWHDVDPADYGAPDPAQLMSPDDRLLLAAHRDRRTLEEGRERARRRGQQRGPHRVHRHRARRRGEERHPGAAGDFDATYTVTDDGELREADAHRRLLPGVGAMTYTLDVRRLRHREGHHRPVTPGDAGRPAAAGARRGRRRLRRRRHLRRRARAARHDGQRRHPDRPAPAGRTDRLRLPARATSRCCR